MVFSLNCFGQVKHDYQIAPGVATCDSLNISGMNVLESILTIEKATFRFKQQFKISRVEGIRSARFYSCNIATGYLILIISKNEYIYFEVPKAKWDELISSSDINKYFIEEIKEMYSFISDE